MDTNFKNSLLIAFYISTLGCLTWIGFELHKTNNLQLQIIHAINNIEYPTEIEVTNKTGGNMFNSTDIPLKVEITNP